MCSDADRSSHPNQPAQLHGEPPVSSSEKPVTPPSAPSSAPPTAPLRSDPVAPNLTGAALHAPWRLSYLENIEALDAKRAEAARTGAPVSFLMEYWQTPQRDEANHVIVRTDEGMILLNGYPYANGHLLVALGDARARLLDYTPSQRLALWRLVEVATELMEVALQPQGINTGINQGRAGGAGVPTHLHVHLVPRWVGDTNFITTVARVQVIPAALDAMAARYRAVWGAISGTMRGQSGGEAAGAGR